MTKVCLSSWKWPFCLNNLTCRDTFGDSHAIDLMASRQVGWGGIPLASGNRPGASSGWPCRRSSHRWTRRSSRIRCRGSTRASFRFFRACGFSRICRRDKSRTRRRQHPSDTSDRNPWRDLLGSMGRREGSPVLTKTFPRRPMPTLLASLFYIGRRRKLPGKSEKTHFGHTPPLWLFLSFIPAIILSTKFGILNITLTTSIILSFLLVTRSFQNR